MATTAYSNPNSIADYLNITNRNDILSNENTYCNVSSNYYAGYIKLAGYSFPEIKKYDKISGLILRNKDQSSTGEGANQKKIFLGANETPYSLGGNGMSSTATIRTFTLTHDIAFSDLSTIKVSNSLTGELTRLYISQVALNYLGAHSQSLGNYFGIGFQGSNPSYFIERIPEYVGLNQEFDIGIILTTEIFSQEEITINTNLDNNYFEIVGINLAHTDPNIFKNVSIDSNNIIHLRLQDNKLTKESTLKLFRVILRVKMINPIDNYSMILNESVSGLTNTIKLPNYFSGTINYSGSKINLSQDSNFILFNDNEIMPETERDVYINNLNLINYTKSELFDIEGEYNNRIDSNYSENKGSVSSLLLDSNTISIKLLSDINNYDTLTRVISEIFMNYKTNLRLKLGVLPNKIIPCTLRSIEPELHRSYSYLTFEFEKLQRTPYNHHTLKNITSNYFIVNNYQREPAVITINGSGSTCNINITDQDGTQSMTINHPFNNEIIIDSKINKVYLDKSEIDLNNLSYDSEFFELKGKCTATVTNGNITKVII